MTSVQARKLLSSYLPVNNTEYMSAGHDIQSDNPLQQILGLLSMGTAPLNQTSNILGDATLKATDSPELATAAYMAPQVMGLPTKALKNVAGGLGKAGLEMMHNGMSFGEGPLAALKHLAPGIVESRFQSSGPMSTLRSLDKNVHGDQTHYLDTIENSDRHQFDPSQNSRLTSIGSDFNDPGTYDSLKTYFGGRMAPSGLFLPSGGMSTLTGHHDLSQLSDLLKPDDVYVPNLVNMTAPNAMGEYKPGVGRQMLNELQIMHPDSTIALTPTNESYDKYIKMGYTFDPDTNMMLMRPGQRQTASGL